MKTTLEELPALRTVVNTDSVATATRQLGQTVSGVSRVLCHLEEKLDITLLSHTTRRLSLIDEGMTLLAQAHRTPTTVDEAEEQVALHRQRPAGRLCVNVAMPFMLHVVAPLVLDSRVRYPQTELEPNTNNLIISLLEEGTGVAIRIGALRDSILRVHLLGTRRLRVLAGPVYLKTHERSRHVDGLQKHALLGFVQPESLNQWPLRGPYGGRLCVGPILKASNRETLCQFALQGAGVVCLADFIAARDRRTDDLVQVLSDVTVKVL